MCLSFYQVATRIPAVFVVPFPKEARSILAPFEVLNVNVAGLSLPLSCIRLGTFSQQMLFTLLLPIAIAAGITLCSFLYALLRMPNDKNMQAAPQPQEAVFKGRGTKDRTSCLPAGGLIALPHLLVLSFLVLPLASSQSFQAFSCEPFDNGKSFLRAGEAPSHSHACHASLLLCARVRAGFGGGRTQDFAVECGTAAHDDAKTLAILGMLYPVGISLLYIVLFHKAKRAILDEIPTALSKALGFLTLDFEKAYYAWELFEAWKKFEKGQLEQFSSNLALERPSHCDAGSSLLASLH